MSMELVFDVNTIRICFVSMTAAFVMMALMGPKVIPVLHKMKFGQEVRDDGPESHLKKQGTPTMGGIMIIAAVIAAVLLGLVSGEGFSGDALKVLFLTVTFGFAGFLDDFLKIKRHNSKGLIPWQKLLLQFVSALIFILWVYNDAVKGAGIRIYVPFTGCGDNAKYFNMPLWLYIPFELFVILGTDNGVNFTDGLDGLCSQVTSAYAALFIIIGLILSKGVSMVSAAVLGALLGFLLFNSYPAKVFMGDTGSLSLGGFAAAAAIVTGCELYILIAGFIYLFEVISVMIQVGYFKATGGKRFFKMAPIHHHFELCGNSETRIVTAFTAVEIILCGLSIVGICKVI